MNHGLFDIRKTQFQALSRSFKIAVLLPVFIGYGVLASGHQTLRDSQWHHFREIGDGWRYSADLNGLTAFIDATEAENNAWLISEVIHPGDQPVNQLSFISEGRAGAEFGLISILIAAANDTDPATSSMEWQTLYATDLQHIRRTPQKIELRLPLIAAKSFRIAVHAGLAPGQSWHVYNLQLNNGAGNNLAEWTNFTSGATDITLKWLDHQPVTTSHFRILRSAERFGYYYPIATVRQPNVQDGHTISEYAFVDHDLIAGVGYYYRLVKVDLAGDKFFDAPRRAVAGPVDLISDGQDTDTCGDLLASSHQ